MDLFGVQNREQNEVLWFYFYNLSAKTKLWVRKNPPLQIEHLAQEVREKQWAHISL